MKYKKDFIENLFQNKAVSSIISLILVLILVISATAGILSWGIPYLNEIQAESEVKSAISSFKSLDTALRDSISSVSNIENNIVKKFTSGEEHSSLDIYSKGDRLICMYSFSESFDFNVGNLEVGDGNENDIKINMTQGTLDDATFYWIDETCFLPGTKVTMSDFSTKNIEDVRDGDKVLSYIPSDAKNGKFCFATVKKLLSYDKNIMGDYYILINNKLRVTPNHILFSNGQWALADNLKSDDFLFSLLESEKDIVSVKKVYVQSCTYDLQLEDGFTYFADGYLALSDEFYKNYIFCNAQSVKYFSLINNVIYNFLGIFLKNFFIDDIFVDNGGYSSFSESVSKTYVSLAGDAFPTVPPTAIPRDDGDTTIPPTTTVPPSAPKLISFNVDSEGSTGWDLDNNDVQVDYSFSDSDSSSCTLLWTFSKGGTPADPTTVSYNARRTGQSPTTSGTVYNFDLNWESGDWSDYSGTVNIKMRVWDGTSYSGVNTSSLSYGIDGTKPRTSIDAISDGTVGPEAITGVSTDNLKVGKVELYIKNVTNNTYWDGKTSWVSGVQWFNADADDGSYNGVEEAWSYDSREVIWGIKTYVVGARTYDAAGNCDDESPATETFILSVINNRPIINYEIPINGSGGSRLNPRLTILVTDPDGDTMNIEFWTNASGNWQKIGNTQTGKNDEYHMDTSNMDEYNTKYWWSARIYDGTYWTNKTYHFTTEHEINDAPGLISFSFIEENYNAYYTGVEYNFNIKADDPEDDTIQFNISWGDGTYNESNYITSSSASESGLNFAHIWSTGGTYQIKVKLRDGNLSWPRETDWIDLTIIYIKNMNRPPFDNDETKTWSPDTGNPAQWNENNKLYSITANDALEDCVFIELYNNNYPTDCGNDVKGKIPFGHIWIFDLGSIEYKFSSSKGIYSIIFENNGVLRNTPDSSFIEYYPNIYKSGDNIIFKVSMIRGTDSISGSGSGDYRLNINAKNNYIRNPENSMVCNFKVKIHGEYAEKWYDHLNFSLNDYGFIKETSSDTGDYLVFNNGDMYNMILSSYLLKVSIDMIL